MSDSSMELHYLVKKAARAALCDGADWVQEGLPGTSQDATATRAALCCQRRVVPQPRALEMEVSKLSPSPASPSPSLQDSAIHTDSSATRPLNSGNNQITAEQKVCNCCSQELETSLPTWDENVNLEQRNRRSPSAKGSDHTWGRPSPKLQMSGPMSLPYPWFPKMKMIPGRKPPLQEVSRLWFHKRHLVLGHWHFAGDRLVHCPIGCDCGSQHCGGPEMERQEKESARLGAHLDRCVIAGLCLLTLGGSLCPACWWCPCGKGSYTAVTGLPPLKSLRKLYGSFNFRMKTSTNEKHPGTVTGGGRCSHSTKLILPGTSWESAWYFIWTKQSKTHFLKNY